MPTLVIVDYGLGNLHSVHKALQRAATHLTDNWQIRVSANPGDLATADRVVFPGVGAIRDCMHGLQEGGWLEPLSVAFKEKPFLSICVGMQALLSHSQENQGIAGLDWIKGSVRKFDVSATLSSGATSDIRIRVPHMGWNQVSQHNHPLWKGIANQSRFYFVHSYYVSADVGCLAGTCEYGITFSAALARDNWFATQFHPEKSHKQGLQLLHNFLAWQP